MGVLGAYMMVNFSLQLAIRSLDSTGKEEHRGYHELRKFDAWCVQVACLSAGSRR